MHDEDMRAVVVGLLSFKKRLDMVTDITRLLVETWLVDDGSPDANRLRSSLEQLSAHIEHESSLLKKLENKYGINL